MAKLQINRKYKAAGFDPKKAGEPFTKTFTFSQLLEESDDVIVKGLQSGKTGEQILELRKDETAFVQIGSDRNFKAVVKRVE